MAGVASLRCWATALALVCAAPLPAVCGSPFASLQAGADVQPRAIVAGEADGRFVPLAGNHYIPRRDEHEVWLRIEFPAELASTASLLTVARLPIESLRLYPRGGSVDAPLWEEAFFAPPPDSEFFSTAFAWRIPPGTPAGSVFYLHTRDRDPTQIRIELRSEPEFDAGERRFTALLAFVLAVLVAMALTNLVFYFALRDRAYLHYVGFVAGLVSFIAVAQNLPYQVDWLRWTGAWTSHAGAITGGLTGLFSATFCQRFVESAQTAPWLHRVLTVFAWAFGAIAAFSLLAWAPGLTPMRQATNFLLLALAFVQFLVGITGWYRGSRASRFFLVAWAGPIVGTTLRALGAAGVVPLTPLLVNSFLIGEAAQALILSIGLADRTLELRRQRDRAQGLHAQAESKLRIEQSRRTALEQQASVDALTGVFNRGRIEAGLTEALAGASAARRPLAIVFIDVDHFKQVNDTHGHVVGDLCLALVARRIREAIDPQHLCGRYGGEEFLVVLPDEGAGEARELAERIRSHVGAEPVPAGDLRIPFRVSVGAAGRRDAESATALVERADRALYEAKRSGRDRVVWAE